MYFAVVADRDSEHCSTGVVVIHSMIVVGAGDSVAVGHSTVGRPIVADRSVLAEQC